MFNSFVLYIQKHAICVNHAEVPFFHEERSAFRTKYTEVQIEAEMHATTHLFFFILDSRKLHPPKNAFYRPRWASKISAIPGSYKRCTPWLELETCCADLKPFAITLRLLGQLQHILPTLLHAWRLWRRKNSTKTKEIMASPSPVPFLSFILHCCFKR